MFLANTWFYYVLPLGVAIAAFVAGLVAFIRDRNAPRQPAAGLDTLCMLASGSFALVVLFTSPTPWARQRLFDHVLRARPEQVEKFILKARQPHQHLPLTTSDVTIDDPATIRRIADLLGSAREVSLNHPRTRWSAFVEMITRDGAHYYFTVSATEPGDVNGTLVNVAYKPEGGGWNLGDFRADGLDAVLESAVQHPATTRSPD
jgi:hypothetical protein